MSIANYAIIVAGGKGLRMNSSLPKQFMEVGGKPIILHTVEKFLQAIPDIKIIVVLPKSALSTWKELKQKYKITDGLVETTGGETRFDSVQNGLNLIEDKDGIVAIHDAVRPCVSLEVIKKCFATAKEFGSALPVVKLKDSVRRVDEKGSNTENRELFRLVQTPQTFSIKQIRAAFDFADHNKFTDDAAVYENWGGSIELVEGNYENIKVTTPEDLRMAQIFLST